MPLLPLAFLGLGESEILLSAAVVLILFGGDKMPELARGLGKALREFRRATSDVEREFKRVMEEAENQTVGPVRKALETQAYTPPLKLTPATSVPATPAPPPPPRPVIRHDVHPPAGDEFHSDI